jgi:hypothetical protein
MAYIGKNSDLALLAASAYSRLYGIFSYFFQLYPALSRYEILPLLITASPLLPKQLFHFYL